MIVQARKKRATGGIQHLLARCTLDARAELGDGTVRHADVDAAALDLGVADQHRWSTRPQRSAVSTSMRAPVSARYAVRWRPMRLATLTVPPAPGTRPIAT